MEYFKRENLLKYGICLLALVLPSIIFKNSFFYYVSSKTFLIYGFISILFPLWLYSLYVDRSYRLTRRQLLLFIPPVLFILWMTIASIFAVNNHLAFWSSFERGTGMITWYFSLAASVIITSLINKHGSKYLTLLLGGVVAGSFILALSVWGAGRGLDLSMKVLSYSRGGGFTGNASVSGAVFIFAIFFGLYLIFSDSVGKKIKIIISAILGFIVLSPAFINIYSLLANKESIQISKGALIGVFIGIGVAALIYLLLSENKKIRNGAIILTAISFVVFSLAWSSFVRPGTYINEKFIELASGSRLIFWDIAQKSMNDHPYLGYGPENYPIAFYDNFNSNLFKDEFYNETINDRAHNIYFDIGVSGGYPAIMFYTIFILSILYTLYLAFKSKRLTALQVGILGGLIVAYIFQNLFFFDSNITIFYLFMFIGVIYGLGDNPNVPVGDYAKSRNGKIITGSLLAIASGISLVYLVIFPMEKSILLQKIISTTPSDDLSSVYSRLVRTSRMGDDRDVSTLSDIFFKSYTYGFMNNKYKQEEGPFLERSVRSFFNYLSTVSNSNDKDFRLQIGQLQFNSIYYFLTNKEVAENSLDIISKAHLLSKNNPEVYWWEAQIYHWKGEKEKAIEAYKKGIAINPGLLVSHEMLLKYAKDTNNKKLYDEAVEQFKKDIPEVVFKP